MSAMLGALCIIVLYKIGRKVYSFRTGVVAAFFLTFASLSIFYSQITKPDTAMVFLLLLAMYFILGIEKTGNIRSYILAGLFAGLACSTKLHSIVIVVPLLLSCLFRGASEEKSIFGIIRDRRIYIGLGF